MLSSTSLFKYEPIQQFRADQSGFFADEARRKAAEQQRTIGEAVAKQSTPEARKPKLELLEVDRFPALTALTKAQIKPAEEAMTESQKMSQALRQRQQSLLPQMESFVNQDVAATQTSLADYLRGAEDIAKGAAALNEASRAAAMRGASGFAERYGAARPNQGVGSEMYKILGDRFAEAQLPYDLQRQQLYANLNQQRYAAQQGALGQRQNLLTRGYDFMRNLSDDSLRPLNANLDTIQRLAATLGGTTFQDVGADVPLNTVARSLPAVSTRRVGFPRFDMGGYRPQVTGNPPPDEGGGKTPPPVTTTGRREYSYESPKERDARAQALADGRARAAAEWQRRSEAEYPQFAEENAFFAQTPAERYYRQTGVYPGRDPYFSPEVYTRLGGQASDYIP